MGTRSNPNRSIKLCGKRHAYCKICKPTVDLANMGQKGVAHKSGCLCPMHKSQKGSNNPNWKGGPDFEWDSSEWGAARIRIWERDKTCRVCGGLPDSSRRFDVHHIVGRRDGGNNKEDNLVGLHHGCHQKVHLGTISLPP